MDEYDDEYYFEPDFQDYECKYIRQQNCFNANKFPSVFSLQSFNQKPNLTQITMSLICALNQHFKNQF